MRKVGTWGVDRFCGMLCEAVLTQIVVILEDRWGRSPGGAEIEDVGENTRDVNGRSCTIDDDADLEGFEDRSSLTPRGLPTCFCKTHFLTVPASPGKPTGAVPSAFRCDPTQLRVSWESKGRHEATIRLSCA